VSNNYQGSSYKRRKEQIEKLKEKINITLDPTVEAACDYIWNNSTLL
jgi:hypothetical protein